MPYSKAEFDPAKQDKYKAAVASAAGTIAANVDILSITEERRRAGSINIETKIRASNEEGMAEIGESLGSGDAVKTKINTELKKQGLREATASSSSPSGGEFGAGDVTITGAGNVTNAGNVTKVSELVMFIITGCVGLVVLLCLCACCFRFQKCARSEEKVASQAISGVIGFDEVVSSGEAGPGARYTSLPPPRPQASGWMDGGESGGVGLKSQGP